MLSRSYLSFAGFIAITAGTFCPLLRPFHLFNWNLFNLNQPYGVLVLIVALAGLAAVVVKSVTIIKVSAWASLMLVILVFIAALLKVHTTFSFIPFKGISAGLTRLIQFKWGWWVLFTGAVAAVVGSGERAENIPYKKL